MKRAFITGTSRGFGHAMASKLLAEDFEVYSCSRTCPMDLDAHERFHWTSLDLAHIENISATLTAQFKAWGLRHLDLVVLNAGQFGPSPRAATEVNVAEFQTVLNINVVANKVILDCLLDDYSVDQVLFCASIAGVRLRAGTLSYGVSKAALNAMAQVYAHEHPNVFFAVLGLCNLQTGLLENALKGPYVEQFPDIVALRARALNADYVTPPQERAEHVWQLYREGFGNRLESGVFSEIRPLIAQ